MASCRRAIAARWVLASASVVATGCGSSASKGRTERAALPLLVYDGGPLIDAPQVVSVTFAGDPLASSLDTFGASVTSSPWWSTVTADFCPDANCIGSSDAGASVQLDAAAPAMLTDSDQGDESGLGEAGVKSWLLSELESGALPAPAPGATSNTMYVLYFPSSTTISFDGLQSCADNGFGGYHNTLIYGDGGPMIPYAVVAECAAIPPPVSTVADLTVLQSTTVTTSHEVLETASDPVNGTGFTLDLNDTNNWAWVDIAGGDEAADLCVDPFGLNQDVASSGAFSVQRIWSNAQAAAGHDPCVPVPAGEVYFNVAPSQAFFVTNVGQSVTFEVTAFADGPTDAWTLVAQDWSDDPPMQFLDISFGGVSGAPSTQVKAGQTVSVTAKLIADPSGLPTQEADGALISVEGTLANPVVARYWPFAVTTHAIAEDYGIMQASRGRRHRPLRRTLPPAAMPLP